MNVRFNGSSRSFRARPNDLQVRSFKEIDLDTLNVKRIDGAAIHPAFEPPGAQDYPTLKSEVGEGMKLYHGSCHCGAVTYTVKHKPLEEVEVTSCNCSWCARVRLKYSQS